MKTWPELNQKVWLVRGPFMPPVRVTFDGFYHASGHKRFGLFRDSFGSWKHVDAPKRLAKTRAEAMAVWRKQKIKQLHQEAKEMERHSRLLLIEAEKIRERARRLADKHFGVKNSVG